MDWRETEQAQLDEDALIDAWVDAGAPPPPEGGYEVVRKWAANGFPPVDQDAAADPDEVLPPAPAPPAKPEPRILVSQKEAAALFGVSVNTFRQHIWPKIRITKVGPSDKIAVSELETYVRDHSARALRDG